MSRCSTRPAGLSIDGPRRSRAGALTRRSFAVNSVRSMAIEVRPHLGVRLGAQRAVAAALVAAAIGLSLGISAPFEKDQEPQSAQWIQAGVQRGEWLRPPGDDGGIARTPAASFLRAGRGVDG